MDPFFITSSVVGLTATCVQTAKALHDIKDKFQTADLTISAICTETTIISASLSQLQSSMLGNTEGLSNKLKERPELEDTLDNALTGCYVVFDVLQAEIRKYTETSQFGSPDIGFRAKIRYVWDESTMQAILTQMRGLQTALSLLLQLLGCQTMAELKQMMDTNTIVLSQIVQRSTHFRVAQASNTPRSIFDMSFATHSLREGDDGSLINTTLFSFDNEIVNSKAYRRALAQAFARHNEDQNQGPEHDHEAILNVKQESLEQRSGSLGDSGIRRSPINEARYRSVDASQSPTESSGKTTGLLEKLGSNTMSDLPSLDATPKDDIIAFTRSKSPRNNDQAAIQSLKENDVQGVPQSESQHQSAVNALIKSESQYLDRLKGSRYFQPKFLSEKLMAPTWLRQIGKVFVTDLWRSFEDIYYANRLLLYDPLTRRQSFDGPWLSLFCDIIRNWIERSGHYYVDFATLHPSAYHAVRTHIRAQQLFANSFSNVHGSHQTDAMMTENYLKVPLYRLQSYVLLLHHIRERSDTSRQNYGQLEDLIKDVKSLIARCDMALQTGQKRVNIELRSRLPDDACRGLLPDSEIQFQTRTCFVRQRVLINSDEFDVIVLVIKTPEPCVLVLRETGGGFLNAVGHLEGEIHADMVFKMSGKQSQADIKLSSHGVGDPIRLLVASEEIAKQLDKAILAIGGVTACKRSVRTR